MSNPFKIGSNPSARTNSNPFSQNQTPNPQATNLFNSNSGGNQSNQPVGTQNRGPNTQIQSGNQSNNMFMQNMGQKQSNPFQTSKEDKPLPTQNQQGRKQTNTIPATSQQNNLQTTTQQGQGKNIFNNDKNKFPTNQNVFSGKGGEEREGNKEKNEGQKGREGNNLFDKSSQLFNKNSEEKNKQKEGNKNLFNNEKKDEKVSPFENKNSQSNKNIGESGQKNQQSENVLFNNQGERRSVEKNLSQNEVEFEWEASIFTTNQILIQWKNYLKETYKQVSTSIDKCMELFQIRRENRQISNILKILNSSVLINKNVTLKEISKMEDQQAIMMDSLRKINSELERENNDIHIHPISNHYRDLIRLRKDIMRQEVDKEEKQLNPENEQLIKIFEVLRFVEEETMKLNRNIDFYLSN